MKQILLQVCSLSFANNNIFNDTRWLELKNRLNKLGYEITTADDNPLENCEHVIFHDASSLGYSPNMAEEAKRIIKGILGAVIPPLYPTRKLYEELSNNKIDNKAMLLIWEGKTICPQNFNKNILDKFARILTWDDSQLSDPKFIKYCMPFEIPKKIPRAVSFLEKKLLVNISFNKIFPHKNELYSARKKSIEFFDKNYPYDFDLFGPRWNIPTTYIERLFPFSTKKYSNYRGTVDNKLETLSKYKFSLCYENNYGAKGYITEKIFDNFHVGTVPIYWGATNIEEYVDANTFIDRRKFSNDIELATFITKITEEEYNEYLDSAKRYMKSEKYAKFQPKYFCDQIIKALDINDIA